MEDWDEVESDIESIGLDDTFDDMDFEDAEFGEEEWDDEDGDEPFDYFIEDEDEDEEEDEIVSPV